MLCDPGSELRPGGAGQEGRMGKHTQNLMTMFNGIEFISVEYFLARAMTESREMKKRCGGR